MREREAGQQRSKKVLFLWITCLIMSFNKRKFVDFSSFKLGYGFVWFFFKSHTQRHRMQQLPWTFYNVEDFWLHRRRLRLMIATPAVNVQYFAQISCHYFWLLYFHFQWSSFETAARVIVLVVKASELSESEIWLSHKITWGREWKE